MDSAFQYVIDNKIAADSDYPYVARDQACKSVPRNIGLKDFVDVTNTCD